MLLAHDEEAAAAELARADAIGPDVVGRHLAVMLAVRRHDWAAAREAARRGLAIPSEREASQAALSFVGALASGNLKAASAVEPAPF